MRRLLGSLGLLVAVAVAALVVAACGETKSPSGQKTSSTSKDNVALTQGGSLTFAMVTHSDEGSFWSVVKKGAQQAAHDALPFGVAELPARRPLLVDDDRGDEDVGARGGQQARHAVGLGAGLVAVGLVEHERDEGADELQAIAAQQRAQVGGLERQVADRAELGRAQAERSHLAQDPLGRQHQPPVGDLADAPRDRGTGQLAGGGAARLAGGGAARLAADRTGVLAGRGAAQLAADCTGVLAGRGGGRVPGRTGRRVAGRHRVGTCVEWVGGTHASLQD